MSSHAIERVLRAEWRRYVAEIAAWVPTVWKPPVLWVGHLPDLPVLDLLLKAAAPAWARQDHLAAFADDDPHKSLTSLEASPLAPLSPTNEGTPAARWLAHWRTLWPRRCTVDCRWLDKLCVVVADNVSRLARAGAQETSARYRGELARAVTRLFRRLSGTPVALFAHLALVALDLERLRGGLVRRKLFAVEPTERAA